MGAADGLYRTFASSNPVNTSGVRARMSLCVRACVGATVQRARRIGRTRPARQIEPAHASEDSQAIHHHLSIEKGRGWGRSPENEKFMDSMLLVLLISQNNLWSLTAVSSFWEFINSSQVRVFSSSQVRVLTFKFVPADFTPRNSERT